MRSFSWIGLLPSEIPNCTPGSCAHFPSMLLQYAMLVPALSFVRRVLSYVSFRCQVGRNYSSFAGASKGMKCLHVTYLFVLDYIQTYWCFV